MQEVTFTHSLSLTHTHTQVTAGGDRRRHQVSTGAPLGVGPWIRRPAPPPCPHPDLRFRQCPSGLISLSVSRVFIRKVSELTESTCNCRPGSGAPPSPRSLAGLGARRTPLPCPAGAGPSPAGAVPPPRGHRQLRRDTGASPPSRGSSEPWGRQRAGPALLSSGSWRGDLPGRHQLGHSGTQP